MPLTATSRKQLKAQAHGLDPVIITGNKGISDNLILETDRALETHELIKIRINAMDREQKLAMAQEICARCKAELVSTIGHIAIIYRKNLQKAKAAKIKAALEKRSSARKSPTTKTTSASRTSQRNTDEKKPSERRSDFAKELRQHAAFEKSGNKMRPRRRT